MLLLCATGYEKPVQTTSSVTRKTNVHSVARRRRQGSDRAAIYTLEAEQLNNNR